MGHASQNRLLKRLLVFNFKRLESVHDEALYNHIVTNIYTSDNTSKQTGKGRFDDLTKGILPYLQSGAVNEIHDVAVSSGQTSHELYEVLKESGFNFNLSISDKYNKYFVTGNKVVRVYDVNRKFAFGYVLCILADNNSYINRLFIATRMLGRLLSFKACPTGEAKLQSLYTKGVTRLLDEGLVTDIDYDVFATRITDRFSFVRCMNLLNLNYFPEDKLYAAVANIVASLKENGTFLVGRTVNSVNHASFYTKQNNRLVHRNDLNAGTEIKFIIERFNDVQKINDIQKARL
jgi:hypothetical protein